VERGDGGGRGGPGDEGRVAVTGPGVRDDGDRGVGIGDVQGAAPFADRIVRWRDYGGGGFDPDDGKPAELTRAEVLIGLADRWKCRPSEVLAEDAAVLRLLDVYNLAHPPEEGGDIS
jgi:hypothetical protein